MHGGDRHREMAGSTRALVAFVVLVAGTIVPSRDAAAAEPRFHPPVVVEARAFPLLLPADGRWLNWRNTYGAPRMRLVNGTWQQVGVHQGIDIFAERGTPIVAITAGTVENLGWTFYSGYRVGLRGADGAYWFYAHMLPRFGPGIAAGVRVQAGQVLGYLGSSGYGPEGTAEEFPPHLHFGLQRGAWVDPDPILVELYSHAVSAARADQSAGRAATLRERKLRSMAYSGQDISPTAIAPALDPLRSARARREERLMPPG